MREKIALQANCKRQKKPLHKKQGNRFQVLLTGDLSEVHQWTAAHSESHSDGFESHRKHLWDSLRLRIVPSIHAHGHLTTKIALAVEQG